MEQRMNKTPKLTAVFLFLAVLGGVACSDAKAESPIVDTSRVHSVALTVEGMTCPSCSVAVRTALKRLDGVREAKVDVAAKRAVVEYEPAKVTPKQLVDAVNRLGYQASLPSTQGS